MEAQLFNLCGGFVLQVSTTVVRVTVVGGQVGFDFVSAPLCYNDSRWSHIEAMCDLLFLLEAKSLSLLGRDERAAL